VQAVAAEALQQQLETAAVVGAQESAQQLLPSKHAPTIADPPPFSHVVAGYAQAVTPEALQQQLEAAVAQAVAAAQEHVQQFLDAANASRAAAEVDVIELRQALAGRDETLAVLQQQLDDARQQPKAGSSGGGSGLVTLQQQVTSLQEEVDSLRRELAAAHQRTHEVTQMYLSAASAAAAAPPAGGSSGVSSGASGSNRFLPPRPGLWRGGKQGSSAGGGAGKPKGLLGLYKRPQVRGLFVMYFVAVHAAVSAIVMRAS
jgi:flagellar biosynthesis chaperone FliJ